MYCMDNVLNLSKTVISPYLILLILKLITDVPKTATQATVNNHLELGRHFLTHGELADALTHYHAAVEGDPNNFMTYFQRATVYLALRKARLALGDLERTLALKPDFTAARTSRGAIHLKQGNLELAQVDFRNVLEYDPYNPEANELINKIAPLHQRIEYAYSYFREGHYDLTINLLNDILDICPWSAKLRKLRAECYIKNNDHYSAILDFKSAIRLETDSTEGYLELSKLLYQLGHATDALKEIRECLKLDPEHPQCFPFYKKIKKVEKFLTDADSNFESGDYQQCILSAEKVLRADDEQMITFHAKRVMCTCLLKEEDISQTLKMCTEALDISPEPNIYCDRAEAYILSEMYDDAIRDYKSALGQDENHQRAKEGLQRAQKLQVQAERRDYYKILDLKRTATKKEVVKAYRKAAQKWHPDNFQGEEKKKAEKKFIDIAAAKEVLTDPEKRAQFDRGEDPLDPESQNNKHGGHHFHHFYSGSPFQFRFHFN